MYVSASGHFWSFEADVCANPDIFDTQIKVCVRCWQVLSLDGLELKILKSRQDRLIPMVPGPITYALYRDVENWPD